MNATMVLAHSAIRTPKLCGLYETTRELVAAIRAMGHDARIVDPAPEKNGGITGEDRGVPIASMDWALKADLIVNHSGIDNTPLAKAGPPVLHVAHGRPLSTFMGERNGSAPGLTWATQRKKDPRYLGAVTFWPEYAPYLRNIWGPKPVYVVPPCVELDYWKPGPSGFDFHGHRGSINVIMTDPWSREDAQPYHCIHAFALFRKTDCSGARLHMFAWDGNRKALTGLTNLLGEGGGTITRWVPDLLKIMRAADMLITPNRVYTRSIREAMACGLQVVSGRDKHPEDIEGFAREMAIRLDRPQPSRKMAEALFDPRETAAKFMEIVKSVVAGRAAA